jgi:hypothetical protein
MIEKPTPSPNQVLSLGMLQGSGSGGKGEVLSLHGTKGSQAIAACPEADDSHSHYFKIEESREERFIRVRQRIHKILLERLDLVQLELSEERLVAKEIRQAVKILLLEGAEPLSETEKKRLTLEMESEILGLGTLEPLLRDPAISEILVNRYDKIFIKRSGNLERANIRF